ncbi:MAG TPA: hypothetical protein VF750_06205 [Sphingomicrobium sp.]
MKRLATILAATAVMASGFAALPTPALAQAGQSSIVVYGNDPCPREYICIRKGESERYRLPPAQNPQGTRQQRQSWAKKSQQLMTVGNTGTMQCSAVGPGGHTGCLTREINQARQEAREQQQADTPPLR